MLIPNEDNKVVPPAGNSPAKDTEIETKPKGDESAQEDADFEKELKDLEAGDEPAKPKRSELEQATFTAKSTLKRIKELGGDPTSLLAEEVPPALEKPAVDTTQFVTKIDLAQAEASKLAKSPNELKLIMWYIKNKGFSVSDAHYMANKGRITKLVGEVTRAKDTMPANPDGGAGSPPAIKVDAPDLPQAEKTKLAQSNMIWNAEKKAYIGKKVQYRYDEPTKAWVTERV